MYFVGTIFKIRGMKKQYAFINTVKFTAIVAIIGLGVLINSCNKKCDHNGQTVNPAGNANKNTPAAVVTQNGTQVQTVTIANIRKSEDGTFNEVMFNELAELFAVQDAKVLSGLQEAFNANKPVQVTVNPWTATVLNIANVSEQEAQRMASREVVSSPNTAFKMDLAHTSSETINNVGNGLAILNTTSAGLTNVIPDMPTAQLMFDYITKQCCALAGPYAIDHCISFQYCQDGCYARAHKMCWILNNTYHYATHKIFSFANSGPDRLSVKCEKWRGCCVTWWYHVAPLVNIKTPTGVKAYVFDPAMFDQPVLLATWLHAQENPACSATPHVSMINIQPTSSYSPSGMTGYTFNTDPLYTSTNSTLISYAPLHTCY
jgi:Glutaminase